MPVTAADVLHVAALARLRLGPAEVARLTVELNDILAHVAELAEADAAGVAPEPATRWPAPLRPDAGPPPALAFPPAGLAPAWSDGFFTVPRVAGMDAPPQPEADP